MKFPLQSIPANVLLGITQLLIFVTLGIATGWIFGFRDGISENAADYPFNYHPLLMVVGWIFLESEALLSYSIVPLGKVWAKLLHVMLHLLSMVSMGAAGYFVYDFHSSKNIDNFYSLHSWMGVTILFLFLVQFVVSFALFAIPFTPQKARDACIAWHRVIGAVVYFGAIMVCAMGLLEKQTFLQNSGEEKFSAESMMANSLGMLLPTVGVCVLTVVCIRHFYEKDNAKQSQGTQGVYRNTETGFEFDDIDDDQMPMPEDDFSGGGKDVPVSMEMNDHGLMEDDDDMYASRSDAYTSF